MNNPDIFLDIIWKTTTALSQDSMYLGQDLNPVLFGHEAKMLTIQPLTAEILVIIIAFITAQRHTGREQGIPTTGCRM
jgi:hypothetical protein